jgi:formylglycine-generating enzyme required for sulfatase activity
LFDMAGNVFEWCAGPDPRNIPARGGAWSEVNADDCAVFRRHVFRPEYRGADVGFRIAIDPSLE